MNYKTSTVISGGQRIVLSSLADIDKLSSSVVLVHFRKYASKRLVKAVLKKCPKLKKISLSPYAFSRVDGSLGLLPEEIEIIISSGKGRPSILDKLILYKSVPEI